MTIRNDDNVHLAMAVDGSSNDNPNQSSDGDVTVANTNDNANDNTSRIGPTTSEAIEATALTADADTDADADAVTTTTATATATANDALGSSSTTSSSTDSNTKGEQSQKQHPNQNYTTFYLIVFFVCTTFIAMLFSSTSTSKSSPLSTQTSTPTKPLPQSYSASYYIFYQFYRLIMNIAGTAIGVGIGLGLALHVRELLDEASYRHSKLLQGEGEDGEDGGEWGGENEGQGQGVGRELFKSQKKSQILSVKKLKINTIPSPFQRHYNTYNHNYNYNYNNTNDGSSPMTPSAPLSQASPVKGSMDSSINGHGHGHGHANSHSGNNTTSSSMYHTLMANAGYAIPKNLLRGQIVRNIHVPNYGQGNNDGSGSGSGGSGGSGSSDSRSSALDCYTGEHSNDIPNRSSLYHFPGVHSVGDTNTNTITNTTGTDNVSSSSNTDTNDNTNTNNNTNTSNENTFSKGKVTFQKMWPNLPLEVQAELGTLIDYIVRDYITSWYCYVDSGVQYENAKDVQSRLMKMKEQQQQQQQRRQQSTTPAGGTSSLGATTSSAMVLSTSATRTIPFLEILYTSITSLLGNFAMCAGDNINVPELVLIKLVHILKVNIKMYRDVRKAVLLKEKERLKEEERERKGQKEEKKHQHQPQQQQQQYGNGTIDNNIGGNGSNNGGTGTGTASGVKMTRSSSLEMDTEKIGATSSSISTSQTPAQTPAQTQTQPQPHPATKTTARKKLEPVSEIAIVKEYLVQGKLHRAITFGMDVPGLLYGDMNGEECPPPDSYNDFVNNSRSDTVLMGENDNESGKDGCNKKNATTTNKSRRIIADEVLKRRLFGNKNRILYECELDYNRVLSHRIARILFQRADFNSPVLRSAVVEMLSSCVITPVMGCFTPDYVNGWIITALEDTAAVASGSTDGDSVADDTTGQSTLKIFDGGESVDGDEDDDDFQQMDDEDTLLDEENEFGNDEEMENVDQVQHTDVSFPHGDVNLSITITNSADVTYMDPSDEILALLSMSLIEIGAFVDYEDARIAKETGDELDVDWDDRGCKEVVRNLLLVIESVLVHGLLQTPRRKKKKESTIDEEDELDVTDHLSLQTDSYTEYPSLINLLMELTSDLESFENKMNSGTEDNIQDEFLLNEEFEIHQIPKPNMTDLSTLRTLIAAWLHTGLVYRTMSVLLQHGADFLFPFYHEEAFILDVDNAAAFLRQLRTLHEVDLIVDLGTVIPCSPLNLFQADKLSDTNPSSFFPPLVEDPSTDQQEEEEQEQSNTNISPKTSSSKRIMKLTRGLQPKGIPGIRSIKANFESNKKKLSSLVRVGGSNEKTTGRQNPPSHQQQANDNSSNIRPISTHQEMPSHLNFRKNEGFATSLRNERESRMKSFASVFNSPRPNVEMICRSRIPSEAHFLEHKDLHNLAKCFYSNTNALILKGDLRKNSSNKKEETKETIESTLVLETIASRRKTRIPEDDSAFLLRAQPNPLDVVSIHRDQRSNSLSYKKYVAYYDEPILHLPSMTDRGARLRKKCFLRYYPNDRTASITFIQHDRRVDFRDKERRKICILLMGVDEGQRPKEFERHPCYKAVRKGTERTTGTLANTILASTLMDSADFTSIPRSGRAIDFLYRLSLFEEPAIGLSGKPIIVQDAAAIGCHQADASSLELSDASLSTAILIGSNESSTQFHIRCDSNGSPVVFLKVIENPSVVGNKSAEKKSSLVYRSFRISYVRAALLVASSRKEAQLKCLLSCLRSGSAKKATKARMDAFLQMPLFLLEYATSKKREKQSVLLRDLKLGINHVDRDQLRRNGIWNPRYPTILKQLKVKVEGAVEVKPNNGNDLLSQSAILYKVRCIAITEYVGVHSDDTTDLRQDGKSPQYGDLFREEWVVWRPFRDFAALHKVLKSIVNPSESSAGAGAKLVGAATGLATAALTIGNSSSFANPSMKRKALVPSLSQAAKAGALGATRKSIEKRKHILNSYLKHLLAPNNLINRCPELLRFIGAYDPFPPEVKLDQGVLSKFIDVYGRRDMSKFLLHSDTMDKSIRPLKNLSATKPDDTKNEEHQSEIQKLPSDITTESSDKSKRRERKETEEVDPVKVALLESIRKRTERVKLSEVRANFFDLMRYIFDLDNASFFRNRMVAALKTVSYTMTSGQGFKKTLLKFHLTYLTGESVAYYINLMREKIWPGGVIFTSAPELTIGEKEDLMEKSSALLHQAFPDQLSALLGQENTGIGLDILHEMLQNRVVLKSMSYMIMDALWLELFPEIGDILTCSNSLDHVED